MRIEIDKWYSDCSFEEFLDIMKKYPYVPFYIERDVATGDLYRYADKEYQYNVKGNRWESLDLTKEVSGENSKKPVSYIVLKSAYMICADQIADKVKLILESIEE